MDDDRNAVTNSIEINNNLKRISVSSAGSCQSDSSEDHQLLERKASLQDIIEKTEDKHLLSHFKQKCRSMSDGEAGKFAKENDNGSFEVFHPNSLLECNETRDNLNEEDIEQKFTSLALSFSIDGATIKNRCERQRRHRDQTETNLSSEIEKLKEKLSHLQPLCTDFEKAELLSTILTQIDIIMKATSLVSIAAERYGSVQHEEQITDSVNLMVKHVQMLKQQRDSARKQLVYTKRMLQNSQESPVSPTVSPKYPLIGNNNRKVICKRRASIASLSQQALDNKPPSDVKKVTRRASELSLRAASTSRSVRPNRLELGGELLKISEGFVIDPSVNDIQREEELESDPEEITSNDLMSNSIYHEDVKIKKINFHKLPIKEQFRYKLNEMRESLEVKYEKWIEDGTLHEVFCFCAFLCFSMSLLIMLNILIEFEYAKRGIESTLGS